MENKSSNRRSFIATTALTSLGLSSYGRDWTGKNPTRYPDPSIISIDPRFDKYKLGNTPVQRLYTNPNRLWNEGCAWNAVGRYLVFSDVPGDLQLRWIEDDNRVTVFRKPSGNSNGNTFDYHGRQISCQHGLRRVVRYEHDGSETVLASHFNGKKFNSPNDVVVNRNDDSIWFTDPSYGIMKNYTGTKAKSELKEAVYRIDSKTGKISKVTDDIIKPNGLCFSPNLKKLYVADTGVGGNDIKVWDIDGEKVKNRKQFTSMKMDGFDKIGQSDGIRADEDGNIWSSAGWVGEGYDGVHIFAPDGDRIGQVLLPEACANLCFGGRKKNRLFMAASQSLYAVYTDAVGAHMT